MSSDEPAPQAFSDFALRPELLQALAAVGYETPTAIQTGTIPVLLEGRDLIGQAQTGTGKTAAFALPLLQDIDLSAGGPQALVLAPTRELAIQVAEAFQKYAVNLPGFHVLPIYGGQDYGVQLRALRRGAHIVVGTPGRVMDHMRRATLRLDGLKHLVLDEADEMLRMGFVDDIEWILEQTPPGRRTALFSATMPAPIRKIAQRYLNDPVTVSVRMQTTTAATIRQRYCAVSNAHKLDALTRILESEDIEGVLVFVRTRLATVDLAERLQARGFASAAINGDMPQKQREKTIEQLKRGSLDILVATDVAARGLDVERVSHVINYDIPYDPEAYVHRIGRTGRAGRHGDAILFVGPREHRMLQLIERATRQPVERMQLPSAQNINDRRMQRFMQSITETLDRADIDDYIALVQRYQQDHDVDPLRIAAALARLLQGDEPLLVDAGPAAANKGAPAPAGRPERATRERPAASAGKHAPDARPRAASARPAAHREAASTPAAGQRPRPAAPPPTGAADAPPGSARPGRPERPKHHERPERAARPGREDRPRPAAAPGAPASDSQAPDSPAGERPHRAPPGMETFRIEVGHDHGVKPANIVGAIASEAGLNGRDIGRIDIQGDHSTVDLPMGMPAEIFQTLKKTRVCGEALRITRTAARRRPSPGRRSDKVAPAPRAGKGKARTPRRKP